MSNSNRRPYQTSTVLDQDFLDDCHDNLENKLELIVDIETPTGFIRASDRPKYVDGVYYDNRLKFPIVSRTVGEWLSTQIALSVLKLELNNADGLYDEFLPGGANYDGFVGRSVTVKLGLRDVGSTFTTIFKGTISDVAGFARTQRSIVITARDDYEKLQVDFPTTVLTQTNFPNITDESAGIVAPIIYGDWTTAGNPQTDNASVPAFIVNGAGSVLTPATNIELFISENDLSFFDTSGVWLSRGDAYYNVPAADITNISVGNRQFEILQDTGNLLIDGANFILEDGDIFFCKVKGKTLGGGTYDDNIVEQVRDILITHSSVLISEFDSSFDTLRDKAAPAESAIVSIKSRVWITEPTSVLEFVLSMLEQVRLEMFINRSLDLALNSLHFDDFVASPTFRVTNFDVEERSLRPTLDERNNFNRGQGVYNFLPDINQNAHRTSIYRNQDAVTQMNKEISKQITFPNLYVVTDAVNQLTEIIKLASAAYEHIHLNLTWRSLLLDIGDFVFLDVKIGSTIYESIPCSIREIGYDPQGIKLPVRLWSYQVVPFPGFSGASGSVGGQTAVITEET